MPSSWPSLNMAILMGKVTAVLRIQWEDGQTSALITMATRKRIADKITGSWKRGMDFHQVEVSPGEPVFRKCWPGTIIQVRGEIDVFQWQPKGAEQKFNRSILVARGFQVIQESAKPFETPRTVLRDYKIRGREERHSPGHTEFDGEEDSR